ncbi:MAG: alpha/beta hydrolase [Myxococcales bacterium]|nr:alpha/beta hydrolase [Myxococcales bacterium]
MTRHMALLGMMGWMGCAEPTSEPTAPSTTPDPVEPELLDLVATDAPVAVPDGTQFFADVPYDDKDLTVLDLFVPPGEGPFPVVMEVHGGGFTGGSKDDFYNWADGQQHIADVLAAGVAFANVEYRLLSLDPPDRRGVIKPLGDVRRGLQFLRWHHEELQLDPEHVVGRGTSAGAGSVLWLATHDDMADPESDDPVEWQSTRLSAVRAFETQGSYDLVRWEEDILVEDTWAVPITINLAISFGLEPLILAFYGMDDIDQMYTDPDIIAYREEVDMLGLLSSDDPPLRVENVFESAGMPLTIGGFYHHPFHALAVDEFGEAVGVDVQAVLPTMEIDESGGETATEFLLRHL